jgi:hypothetical protein
MTPDFTEAGIPVRLQKEGGPCEETTQELPTASYATAHYWQALAIHLADLCLVPVALSPDEVVESLANTQGGEPIAFSVREKLEKILRLALPSGLPG